MINVGKGYHLLFTANIYGESTVLSVPGSCAKQRAPQHSPEGTSIPDLQSGDSGCILLLESSSNSSAPCTFLNFLLELVFQGVFSRVSGVATDTVSEWWPWKNRQRQRECTKLRCPCPWECQSVAMIPELKGENLPLSNTGLRM